MNLIRAFAYFTIFSLNREFSQYIYQVFLDWLIILDSFCERNVYYFVMFDTDHYIALSIHDGINSCRTESASKDTIVSSRTSTALQVSKDSNTYIVLRIFILHTLCKVYGSTCQFAFRNNYNTTVFGFAETVFDEFFQLIDFRTELWNDSGLCT